MKVVVGGKKFPPDGGLGPTCSVFRLKSAGFVILIGSVRTPNWEEWGGSPGALVGE